jgi:hypothetical protein
MALRPDLVMAVAGLGGGADDKGPLDRVVDQAAEAAQAGAAATTGTALHALTERLDRGQPVGVVPEAYRADLDAYERATAELGHLAIEQFTVHDELKIGGTPDRVVRFRGGTYIADIKSGSIAYGAAKFAMQLAVYAHSTPYDHVTETRAPYPADVDTDRGIIIHLPAGQGTCTLRWVDLATGWAGVQLAAEVRAWRAKRLRAEPVPPVPDPADGAAFVLEAIGQASTVYALRAMWHAAVAAGFHPDDVTRECLARKAELERVAT